MLGQSRRRQEPIQTSQGSAHLGSRVVVDPPSVSATCGDIRPANRTDLAKNVLKRRFVEGCFLLRHVEPEIDDVHVSWSSGEVKAGLMAGTARPSSDRSRSRPLSWPTKLMCTAAPDNTQGSSDRAKKMEPE